MRRLIFLFVIGLITTTGFAKMRIVTSIFPIADITKNIVKDKAEVNFIIPAEANPHTFEPTPKQAKMIADADVFIGVSKQFDGWVEKFLKKDAKKIYILNKPVNPHIWLSFTKSQLIVSSIRNFLVEIDYKNRNFYRKQSREYAAEIAKLYQKYLKKFSALKNKSVIQYHPAWDYLAADLKLEIAGTIYTGKGKKATIKHLTEILEIAKKRKTKAILCGLGVKDKVIDIYVQELKGEKVELDTTGNPDIENRNSFLKMLTFNAERIFKALSK